MGPGTGHVPHRLDSKRNERGLDREVIPLAVEIRREQDDPPAALGSFEQGRRAVGETCRNIPPFGTNPPRPLEPHLRQGWH